MNLQSVRSGIAERLATIDGLRVFDFMPQTATPPCAVVGFPERLSFDLAFARGLDEVPVIPVYVFVGGAHERSSQAQLSEFCAASGSTSIKEAIEADLTLGGTADTCRVVQARGFANYPIGAVEHLGCIFDVQVFG